MAGSKGWTQVQVKLKRGGGMSSLVRCTIGGVGADILPLMVGAAGGAPGTRAGGGSGAGEAAITPPGARHAFPRSTSGTESHMSQGAGHQGQPLLSPGAEKRFRNMARRRSGGGIAEAAAAATATASAAGAGGQGLGAPPLHRGGAAQDSSSGLLFCILVEVGGASAVRRLSSSPTPSGQLAIFPSCAFCSPALPRPP